MIRQQTYEDGTLTTLLFDGGYVSLDFIRPFLAMPKLKLASLWSFGLTKTFTKTGSVIHATYTPTYHFYMRDHLGSNCVVASVTGEAGLKGRKGTNALYYYGMREATNHPFFCPVCLLSRLFVKLIHRLSVIAH